MDPARLSGVPMFGVMVEHDPASAAALPYGVYPIRGVYAGRLPCLSCDAAEAALGVAARLQLDDTGANLGRGSGTFVLTERRFRGPNAVAVEITGQWSRIVVFPLSAPDPQHPTSGFLKLTLQDPTARPLYFYVRDGQELRKLDDSMHELSATSPHVLLRMLTLADGQEYPVVPQSAPSAPLPNCCTSYSASGLGPPGSEVIHLAKEKARTLISLLLSTGAVRSEIEKSFPMPPRAEIILHDLDVYLPSTYKYDANTWIYRLSLYTATARISPSANPVPLSEAKSLWSFLTNLGLQTDLGLGGADLEVREVDCKIDAELPISALDRFQCDLTVPRLSLLSTRPSGFQPSQPHPDQDTEEAGALLVNSGPARLVTDHGLKLSLSLDTGGSKALLDAFGTRGTASPCLIENPVLTCVPLLLTLENHGRQAIRSGPEACDPPPISFEVEQKDGSWREISRPDGPWVCSWSNILHWETIPAAGKYEFSTTIADYPLDTTGLRGVGPYIVRAQWNVYGCIAQEHLHPEGTAPPSSAPWYLLEAQCKPGTKPQENYARLVSNPVMLEMTGELQEQVRDLRARHTAIQVLVPTELKIQRAQDAVTIRCDPRSDESVMLIVDRSMVTGIRADLRVYPIGTARPAQPDAWDICAARRAWLVTHGFCTPATATFRRPESGTSSKWTLASLKRRFHPNTCGMGPSAQIIGLSGRE